MQPCAPFTLVLTLTPLGSSYTCPLCPNSNYIVNSSVYRAGHEELHKMGLDPEESVWLLLLIRKNVATGKLGKT